MLTWVSGAVLACLPAAASAQPVFASHNITTGAPGAVSVFAADIDDDGDTDILSASSNDHTVRWYRNDGNQVFTASTISTTASNVRGVFAADINGDGALDVLSASEGDNSIRWYEGQVVAFGATHTITTGAIGAQSVFAADVDGDGDTDVLSASRGDNAIRWYENDGNENFTARNIFTSAFGAQSVFAIDVDGDGDTDVLSASFNDNSVRWHENDGNQNFTARNIMTGASGARSVFASDLDGDGDIDVLSASQLDNAIRWYENDGNQNFTVRNLFLGAVAATSVFASDMDGDGDNDVLSSSFSDNAIRWYENDGSGNFTARNIFTGSVGAISVFASDVDSDGDTDVCSASFSDNAIRWYENDGGIDPAELSSVRNLTANTTHTTIQDAIDNALSGDQLRAGPARFAAGDPADFDGKAIELRGIGSVIQTAAGSITLADSALLGNSFERTLELGAAEVLLAGPSSQRMELYGSLDVLEGDLAELDAKTLYQDDFASINLGASSGLSASLERAELRGGLTLSDGAIFSFPGDLTLRSTPHFASAYIVMGLDNGTRVIASDIDSDGDTDVISATSGDNTIRWYENIGNNIFSARDIFTSAIAARCVFAIDIDGDGDTDVISASQADNAIRWHENDGAQNFATHTLSTTSTGAITVYAADINNDGHIDIVAGAEFENSLRWYQNSGPLPNSPALFSAHDIDISIGGIRSVIASDIDEDGDIDVLAAARTGFLYLYENNGNAFPTLTRRIISLGGAPGARSIITSDLDEDGDIDLLTASENDNTVRWFENDGNENFTPIEIFTTAQGASCVFAADLDGDGDIDVLSSSQWDSAIRWYENDGQLNFTPRRLLGSSFGSLSVFAADLDGDGDIDVLSGAQDIFPVRRHENRTAPAVATLSTGALLAPGGSINNSRPLELDGGIVSAINGFTNNSLLAGHGQVMADTHNTETGSVIIEGNTSHFGSYTNDGSTTIEHAALSVAGVIVNNGAITGELPNSHLNTDSNYSAGELSSLMFPQSGQVLVGGNYDNACNSNTRFDLAFATLRLEGAAGSHSVEVMSLDIGADFAGLDRTIAGHYPIGTLRIGPTPTDVNLVDVHDNAGDGQADHEAIYVRDLIIDPGTILNTNGCTVYYETLTLDGTVDNPMNLVPLIASAPCPGDCDESGAVDFNDLVSMLFEFGTPGSSSDCDTDGSGNVDFNDLVGALFLFGACE